LLRFIFFLDSLRLNTTDRTTESKSWLIDFVLLGATWGSSFLFTRLAVVDFGALPSAGMRVVIGAAVLLVMLYARRQLSVLGIHWRKTFFVGLLNSAIPFACFAWALLTITTGLSSILNATVPLAHWWPGYGFRTGLATPVQLDWLSVSPECPCWPGTNPAWVRC
jgi:drug/metabolite transporter (DMT)-like permease